MKRHDLDMADLVRDSAFGQLIRLATRNKYFLYEEEKAGFKVPNYEQWVTKSEKEEESATPRTAVAFEDGHGFEFYSRNSNGYARHRNSTIQMAHVPSPVDIERALSRVDGEGEEGSNAVEPKRTANGKITIDWYSTDRIFRFIRPLDMLTISRRSRESPELELSQEAHRCA